VSSADSDEADGPRSSGRSGRGARTRFGLAVGVLVVLAVRAALSGVTVLLVALALTALAYLAIAIVVHRQSRRTKEAIARYEREQR
jgi:hypothetical protein